MLQLRLAHAPRISECHESAFRDGATVVVQGATKMHDQHNTECHSHDGIMENPVLGATHAFYSARQGLGIK